MNIADIKAYILLKDNTISTYTVRPEINLQPLINMHKRRNPHGIEAVYLQYRPNEPMVEVTNQYDI